MPNRLIYESSPYLLHHAENPVEWMPWGAEAFEKAKTEDKPIFLSIGYSSCHWCHVMAHESFEDPEVARIMNEHFINIKVDREEKPEIDSIYMNAVVSMTGQGGWPLSVFLTPEGEPFFGSTYFPPQRRYGMPSFSEVLLAAARAWEKDRQEIRNTAHRLTAHISTYASWGHSPNHELRSEALPQATRAILSTYDWQFGGWGPAPRFPQPMSIEFLLLQGTRGNSEARQAALHHLRVMNRGGIMDVVGGGFARYSTDDHWLVPHFEKMLYDNAQLALAYLHGGLLEKDELLLATATKTLDFILRELTHPDGGFYSSLDADSEGVEGKFYLWSHAELKQAINSADDFEWFSQVYDLPASGNFDGQIILQQKIGLEQLAHQSGSSLQEVQKRLDAIHQRLLEVRSSRSRPSTDDKVLLSWNGLALRALAEAARYLHRADYLKAAQKNADFLLHHLQKNGTLYRSWRNGKVTQQAFLEDYASFILGLLSLYQTDFNLRWYQVAHVLTEEMITQFHDPAGGFFDVSPHEEVILYRTKDFQDQATPCGNSLATLVLLHMAEFTGENRYRPLAESNLATFQDMMIRHPTAFGCWLQALDFSIGPTKQLALIFPAEISEDNPFIKVLWNQFRPRLVTAVLSPPPATELHPPLVQHRPLQNNRTTAYICEGFTCKQPVYSPEEMDQQLSGLPTMAA
ncbi:MAG TPA: thioredoxin domain-containing protein [Anaerolinea thermolimosa]|uniref:Thioredoxin domain-containing protein n=1 Tax=Anaerolinea thermolimosa TaxID=229919 RepID=A0A3D1JHB1_9CHLR|nr:thioredoxin domain-containing protein [Anaerolinea thermolimosa]GAP06254.1 highly conserved protein containing a thioredoxin domain [Anaerolinea thermolimosa]HCE17902.1 thioredoxin domain-containing protein [Anaerolinea thermolimosa]